MRLVIVESPAKCAKIQSFLGDGYRVQATMGHIRALEESLDSVGIDRDWVPSYAELPTKRDAIARLRAAARGADVWLATDDDREGEGIAWHVCALLRLDPATTPRIVFHEITRPAILAAVAAPRRLDLNKVNAQQARAMLDLLVGFTISKVLWNRVAPRLSAGRCQTPALRLVVERDAEVEGHVASAFWRLRGAVVPTGATAAAAPPLEMTAVEDVPNADAATAALHTAAHHTNRSVRVLSVKESVSTAAPPKPLITSTLQQEASALHGLGPKATMTAAQKLYEAGHITYMRTDNALLSTEAAEAIRAWVTATHGETFVGSPGQHTVPVAAAGGAGTAAGAAAAASAGTKKKGKSAAAAAAAAPVTPPAAQAAHEAIRPTHPELTEVPVDDHAQQVLYKLIWRRAAQSQMAPATTDVRKVTLALDAEQARVWTAEQTKTRFAGWKVLERAVEGRAAAEDAAWTSWQPHLSAGATLTWTSLAADEQFTKPRGRYTEASLVAELEKRGIGRPSTFATLLSTIQDREYVEKTNDEGTTRDSRHLTLRPSQWPPTETVQTHKVGAERNKLRATALGRSVAAFLVREYDDLFNYDFTAGMEADLDNIARGTAPWKALLQRTWDTYKERYTAMTSRSGEGAAAAKAARQRELAEGLKVILSRKGPLLVKDPPAGSPKDTKATFAPLPAGKTFETVSAADADAAFAAAAVARAGDLIGHLEGDEIRKKRGPYGLYAECKGARVPLKGDEDLARIQEKLVAKISFAASGDAFERKVGDFTIKRGPYGYYFYKHALKRVRFVKFPAGVEPTTATAADLTAAYAAPSRGGGGGRGGRGGARGGRGGKKVAAGGAGTAAAAAAAPEEEE